MTTIKNNFLYHFYFENKSYDNGINKKNIYKNIIGNSNNNNEFVENFPDRIKKGIFGKNNKNNDSIEKMLNQTPDFLKPYTTQVINIIKEKTNYCHFYGIGLIGNDKGIDSEIDFYKHIHNTIEEDKGYTRVISILIPLLIREPIKEYIFFQWTNYQCPPRSFYIMDDGEPNISRYFKEQKEAIDSRSGPITEIKFPNENQILLLDFNATNWVHWAENLSSNVFISILIEI